MVNNRIKELAAAYKSEFIANRRHLHANPELSFQEFQTAAFVEKQLRGFGINQIEHKAQMKKILKPEQFAKWEEKQSERKKNQSEKLCTNRNINNSFCINYRYINSDYTVQISICSSLFHYYSLCFRCHFFTWQCIPLFQYTIFNLQFEPIQMEFTYSFYSYCIY